MNPRFISLPNPFSAPWRLWLPLALLALEIAFEQFAPRRVVEQFVAENGLIEIFQFLLIFFTFFVAADTLRRLDIKVRPGLFAWVGLAALGSFYVAGEEISWGQHFFQWATPELWKAINDQNETNLHNTSAWLDQKPRILLGIGVLSGGLVLPWIIRFWPRRIPGWLQMIAPPPFMGFVAGIYLFVKLADLFGDTTGWRLFARPSEVCEFYMYYFVMIYVLYLRKTYA